MVTDMSEKRKRELIVKLVDELPVLRTKTGLSQEELASIIGISRQTYSAMETQKKGMQWRTYFPLLMFFDRNPRTHDMLRQLKVFPVEYDEVETEKYSSDIQTGKDGDGCEYSKKN